MLSTKRSRSSRRSSRRSPLDEKEESKENNEETKNTSITKYLLNELYEIASNSARCSFALEALLNGNTKQNDIRTIACSVFMINRIIKNLNQAPKLEISVKLKMSYILTLFCSYLSKVLLSDRPRLERCAGCNLPRRAIISIVIGAVFTLENLCSYEKEDKNLILQSLQQAIESLETLVNFTQKTLTLARNNFPADSAKAVDSILSANELKTLKKASEDDSIEAPPSKRRRKTEDTLSTDFFSSYPEENATFDGRVSIKRWAAMTYVWLCQGQIKSLQIVNRILKKASDWSKIIKPLPVASKGLRKARSRKKSQEKEPQSTPAPSCLSFVCRLLELSSEAGTSSGSRAPPSTAGMDNYVSYLYKTNQDEGRTQPLRSLRASSRAAKSERTDLRTMATSVVELLIKTHFSMLPQEKGLFICSEEPITSQSKFVKVIDAFSRLVANSVPTTNLNVSDTISRMSSISSAYILGLSVKKDQPLDGDLVMFAISRFSTTLSSLVADTESVKDKKITEYSLSQGITPDEYKSNPTFAGIFSKLALERNSCGDIFALFLRAMYDDGCKTPEELAEKLMTKIIYIVKCCFSSNKKNRSLRIALATDALNILRKILVIGSTSVSLLKIFRESMTPNVISEIVSIGKNLENFLFPLKENAATLAERHLWSSHIKLCLTVGRGQSSYEVKNRKGNNVLGDTNCRALVFEAIHNSLPSELEWLCLPSYHHAILNANLTSMSFSSTLAMEATVPEYYVCIKIKNSMKSVLSNPKLLLENEERFPLSLRDVRLFCVAVSHLVRSEQCDLLSELIEHLHQIVVKTTLKEFLHFNVVSSFLGRLLTTIASLVDIISSGTELSDLLAQQLGPTHYHIPHNDVKRKDESSDFEWYKKEIAFMGIFSDWESPSTPYHNEMNPSEALTLDGLAKLHEILENFLEYGFLSAKYDHLYLLFSTWNANGKFAGWDRFKNWIEPSSRKIEASQNSSSKLFTIRNDLIYMYRRLNPISQIKQDSLFIKRLLANEEKTKKLPKKFTPVTQLLQSGVNDCIKKINSELKTLKTNNLKVENLTYMKADKIMSYGVDEKEKHERKKETETFQSPSSPTFAYLEALVIYLSFLTAQFTIVEEDTSNTWRAKRRNKKRRRKHLSTDSLDEEHCTIMEDCDEVLSDDSGSNIGYSDFPDDCEDEECDDARVEQLARIHESCLSMSSAPMHPDYLDTSCRARDGMTDSMIVDIAESILNILTKLACTAFSQYYSMVYLCLGKNSSHKNSSKASPNLAVSILSSLSRESKHAYFQGCPLPTSTHSLISEISDVCNLPDTLVSLLSNSPSEQHCSYFCPNVNTMIKSKVQDLSPNLDKWDAITDGELRALGEWEFLLSKCLLGAYLKNSTSKYPDGLSYVSALRWDRLLSITLSSMASASSLLYFGLSFKGRQPHPRSQGAINKMKSIYDIAPKVGVIPKKDLSRFSTNLVQKVKISIRHSLALLGRIGADGLASHHYSICKAISSNLVKDVMPLHNLEKLHALKSTIDSLHCLSDIGRGSDIIWALIQSLEYNSDGLANFSMQSTVQNKNTQKWSNLLIFFSFQTTFAVDTIVEEKISLIELYQQHHSETLAVGKAKATFELLFSFLCQSFWQSLNVRVKYQIANILSGLLEYVLFDSKKCKASSNIETLSVIMVEAFNSLNSYDVVELVKDYICILSSNFTSEIHAISLSQKLSQLIALLCSAAAFDSNYDTHQVVLDTLLSMIDKWTEKLFFLRENVMDLLCLLATKFNRLKDVGELLVQLIPNLQEHIDSKEELGNYEQRIMAFESFLHFLYEVLSARQSENYNSVPTSSKKWTKNSGDPGDPYLLNLLLAPVESDASVTAKKPLKKSILSSTLKKNKTQSEMKSRTCSFVETNGEFLDQHWYNCYTCGLLWDKGCCSICAQVCHKDCDVVYARRSSFFCDCGAEIAHESRVSCECLNPLSSKDLALLSKSRSSSSKSRVLESSVKEDNVMCIAPHTFYNNGDGRDQSVRLVVKYLADKFDTSFESLSNAASKAKITEKLFHQFHYCFDLWRKKNQDPFAFANLIEWSYINQEKIPSALTSQSNEHEVIEMANNSAVCIRNGKLLDLHPGVSYMMAVRASKPSVLKLNNFWESCSHRFKKSMVTKSNAQRRIVSDSRGRLIIAEHSSLTFCCGLALVNTRFADKPLELLERPHLNILGNVKMKYFVLGMKICPFNDRHLLVWGISEASVLVLNKACDSVQRQFDLLIENDADECDTEQLLSCDWIPGSETISALCFTTAVRLFDIRMCSRSTGESFCYFTSSYILPFDELSIKSAVFIYDQMDTTNAGNGYSTKAEDYFYSALKDYTVKLVLLLDTGRLCLQEVYINSNGEIEDQGESCIESNEGLRFPTSNIRRYLGASPIAPGSTSSSFGEGSNLFYLKQAGLLLYKCLSAPLIAFKMDKRGKIVGSFELLPHVITSEMLGGNSEGSAISGPFTHFNELGIVKSGENITYRFSCVGKLTRTGAPKLLGIELNEEKVSVTEINWPCASSFVGISQNVEGSCAFSAPYAYTNNFIERSYLVVLYSSGLLLLFGENIEQMDARVQMDTTNADHNSLDATTKELRIKPDFPLTIFETLINISDFSEGTACTIGGDIISNESTVSVMKKLSTSNGDFLACPSKDGCTLTVSLRGSNSLKNNESFNEKGEKRCRTDTTKSCTSTSSLVIVAVRFLCGATTLDNIPRYITIMGGRRLELKHGIKRYYDVLLNDEEIMLSVRCGVVSCVIGPAFSSNTPAIDAVEVYAKKRDELFFLLASPKKEVLYQNKYSGTDVSKIKDVIKDEIFEESCNALLSSMKCIVYACNTLNEKLDWSKPKFAIIQQLIEMTVLENGNESVRNNVLELLKIAEPDHKIRQSLFDKGTLTGVFRSIEALKKLYSNTENSVPDFESSKKIIIILSQCLKSALAIARSRPLSYKKSNESIHVDGGVRYSIAYDSKFVLDAIVKGRSLTFAKRTTSTNITGPNFADEAELAALLVELALFEMAADNHEAESTGLWHYADFNLISDFLRLENALVVQECCATIAKVLSEGQTSCVGIVNDLGPRSEDSEQQESRQCNQGSKILSTKEEDPIRAPPPIAYQCDSCKEFPISSVRYTLDGEDIDLCSRCFDQGTSFARNPEVSPNDPVDINNKTLTLGKDSTKFTCEMILQMNPVPVEDVTLVNREVTELLGRRSMDTEQSSTSGLPNSSKKQDELSHEPSLLRNSLFDSLLDEAVRLVFLLSKYTSTDSEKLSANNTFGLNNILTLVLHLVFTEKSSELQLARGKKVVVALVTKLKANVEACFESNKEISKVKHLRSSLIVTMRTLSKLVKGKDNSLVEEEDSSCGTKSKDKTDPRFVCDHGIPALRRRCSQEGNKDRRFYACAFDRKARCDYFKWADEPPSKETTNTSQKKLQFSSQPCRINSSDREELQSELWKLFSENDAQGFSLQSQLCDLLKSCFHSSEEISLVAPEKKSKKKNIILRSTTSTHLNSLKNEKDQLEEINDGVILSRDKFGPFILNQPESSKKLNRQTTDSLQDLALLHAAFDLLSILATNSVRKVSWSTGWFSLLCEILSTSTNSLANLRLQAKRMLKRLCGSSTETFNRVKDHYIFASQFKQLLDHSYEVLLSSIETVARANRCSPNYKSENQFHWQKLSSGGLLGLDGLIEEISLSETENISAILDSLLEVVKVRRENWRYFCALKDVSNSFSATSETSANFFYDRSPICSLLWLACSLTGINRVKVFNLIDAALSIPSFPEDSFQKQSISDGTVEDADVISFDGMGNDVITENGVPFQCRLKKDVTPEQVLLNEISGLRVTELCVFVSQFVLRGKTAEARNAASNVIEKLCHYLSASNLQACFTRFMGPLLEVGFFGIESVQLLQLLQKIIHNHGKSLGHEIITTARIAIECFIQQVHAVTRDSFGEHIQLNDIETESGSVSKFFDLSSCIHCHRIKSRVSEKFSNMKSINSENSNSISMKNRQGKNESSLLLDKLGTTQKRASEKSETSKEIAPWLDDQVVRPYMRSRLEGSLERAVSTEFASYVQLKYRLALCEIFLSVSDPRGRYVKNIEVFFSSTQVNDANELKSDEFIWQPCAKISLARGASKASCVLKTPIIASNLKFEYTNFYERAGSTKSAEEGGISLSCPRCTRVVNNPHGVCGHCGEVAFQCRKCRHINYNALDAFLCVECGYCSSGSFSYELTAAVSSNAVAIVDGDGFDRSMKLLRIAMKREGETRSLLRRKLLSLSRDKQDDFCDEMEKYNSHLNRALMGELPKSSIKGVDTSSFDSKSEKRSGLTSTHSRSQTSKISIASSKARSLLNLARQLRNEAEGTNESDRLRQALLNIGGTGGVEFFEDGPVSDSEGDIFGVINASGGTNSSSDLPGDSLSRLVANIQAKVQGSSIGLGNVPDSDNSERRSVKSTGEKSGDKSNSKSKRNIHQELIECDRLYQQMRENERESFELHQTINAWKRLNNDALTEFGSVPSSVFVPSLCSKCSDSITVNLLLLIQDIFNSEVDVNEIEIKSEFVQSLFQKSKTFSPEVTSLQRKIIINLVEKSDHAAKLVLEELFRRVSNDKGDKNSADILGDLLKSKTISKEYLDLAVEILSSS